MKIEYLEIKLDMYSSQKLSFSSHVNVIHSLNNSKGKTSLIRIILYILGFRIQPTRGIDFDLMEYKMILTNAQGKLIEISRLVNTDFKYVHIKSDSFHYQYIHGEHFQNIQLKIFEGIPTSLITNILGVFYIDQEKGWTLLNRGKVIGSIPFNIESFIRGLAEVDLEKEIVESKELDNQIKQYKHLLSLTSINNDEKTCISQGIPEPIIDKFSEKINIIQSEIIYYEKELKSIKKIKSDNASIAKLIDDLNLTIIVDNKRIPITRNNVEGLPESINFLEIRRKALTGKIQSLKKEYTKLIEAQTEYQELYTSDDLLNFYKRKLCQLNLNQFHITNAIKSLSIRKAKVDKKIKYAVSENWIEMIGKDVLTYLDEFGVRFNYKSSINALLTSNLYPYSGAEMTKRVLAFHLSYVKAVRKKYNVYLPIIIDSPYSKESDQLNFSIFLNILKRDFSMHQVFIATIHRNQITNYNLISLDNGLLDGKIKSVFIP